MEKKKYEAEMRAKKYEREHYQWAMPGGSFDTTFLMHENEFGLNFVGWPPRGRVFVRKVLHGSW